jgi:YHS domain-containing protein
MDIDGDEAMAKGLVSEYQGQMVVFCSEQCKQEFDANPEIYAADGLADKESTDDSDYAY